jgi:hypothetical protein
MPVHPESAMRREKARESIERQVGETGTTDGNSARAAGGASRDIETEDRRLKMKAWGLGSGDGEVSIVAEKGRRIILVIVL